MSLFSKTDIIKLIYLFSFLAIFIIYNIFLYYALTPKSGFDYFFFAIMDFPLLMISYLTFHVIFTLIFLKSQIILKKTKLSKIVRVAVVLGIYNDLHAPAFIRTIETIRKNSIVRCDFFLVSDSTNDSEIEMEKKFAIDNSIGYLHRNNRKGQRPGAINDWAKSYLFRYDYFMVLDKDSIIDDVQLISTMAEILEHPENSDIAVVQSSLLNANHKTRFSHYIGDLMQPSRNFTIKNDMLILNKALYWGHNGLIRKNAYIQVGGFSENHLCDDVIFSMKLDSLNWRVAYCPELISYEYIPSDFLSFRDRANRWARANLGTVKFLLTHINKISNTATFYAFLPIFSYINVIFLMLILIIGLFIPLLKENGFISIGQSYFWDIGFGLILYILILVLVFFGRIVAVKNIRQGLHIFKCSLYEISISLNAIPSLFATIITYPIFRNKHWDPFSIKVQKLGLIHCFNAMKFEFLFGIIILSVALFLQNWIWIITALPYLLNFLLGPFLLYFYSKKPKDIQKELSIFDKWCFV